MHHYGTTVHRVALSIQNFYKNLFIQINVDAGKSPDLQLDDVGQADNQEGGQCTSNDASSSVD